MAQLKDTIILGKLNVTGVAELAQLYTNVLMAPSSSDSATYGTGTNGQVLLSNGSSVYWGTLTIPQGTITSITPGAGLTSTSNDTLESATKTAITSSGTLYLTKTGVTAGTYQGITVDKYGRVTAASDQGYSTLVLGNNSTTAAAGNHSHGNLSNSGTIGTASRIVVTNSSSELITGSIDPSDLVVKNDINSLLALNDAMVFKGTIGTGGTVNSLPSTYSAGETYKVITAGTYAGMSCEVGDLLIAITDNDTAANAADAHWTSVQTNNEGLITGPSSSINNEIPIYDSTTGKIIKKSGILIRNPGTSWDGIHTTPNRAANDPWTSSSANNPMISFGNDAAITANSDGAFVFFPNLATTSTASYLVNNTEFRPLSYSASKVSLGSTSYPWEAINASAKTANSSINGDTYSSATDTDYGINITRVIFNSSNQITTSSNVIGAHLGVNGADGAVGLYSKSNLYLRAGSNKDASSFPSTGLTLTTTDFSPTATNTWSLGNSSSYWKSFNVSSYDSSANNQTYGINIGKYNGSTSTVIGHIGASSGLGLYSAGNLYLRAGDVTGASGVTLSTTEFYPSANNTWSLGTSTYKWSNVYAVKFTGNVTGNVSGTAANVTGTVAIANGGTGATTAADALTNLGAASSSHVHGNITNDGKITSTATIANGDKIVIVDSDTTAGSKITGSSITFDGSTTTKALTQKGTWETFNNYSHPTYTSKTSGLYKITVDGTGHVSATASVEASDIPALPASKITSGTFADARIDSAATWNAKQDALEFITAYNETTNKVATAADITKIQIVDHTT